MLFQFSKEDEQELRQMWFGHARRLTDFAATVVEMVEGGQEELFYDAQKGLRLAAKIGAICASYESSSDFEKFLRDFPTALRTAIRT
jgi:hypothetical protein